MPIESTDKLSRYLLGRVKNYLRSDNTVKYSLFYPKDGNNKLSVYQISGLTDNEVWDIGREVASTSGRSLSGRADILTLDITNTSLDVVESVPPPRHADIIGWPQDKADRMALATKLAEAAQGYRI